MDPELREQGWTHIGDPDSYDGYILDAYQGSPAAKAKLFLLTAPNGAVSRYVHRLLPGETYHNSFTAIAPGGQWFVSGEWGTLHRLLVFPMPGTNPLATPGHNLPLAGTIELTRPVRNVQGCAFASATSLVCSTNDPGTDLFPISKQLLGVQLAKPLDGSNSVARVHLLGAVPQHAGGCPISGETEGLDINGTRMLLNVASACSHTTTIYTYRRAAAISNSQAGSTAPGLSSSLLTGNARGRVT